MTEEAILKAEEELKVPSKPPKINRDTHITPSTLDTVSSGANVVKHVITESPAKVRLEVVWMEEGYLGAFIITDACGPRPSVYLKSDVSKR